MRLYLDRNLVTFGRRESSFGYRLTSYIDGLSGFLFDEIKDWQNALLTHLNLDRATLQVESSRLVQDIHRSTEKEWEGYHCFIYIHNMHAVLLFVPIESKETPYNQTGWCHFSQSYPVDLIRLHLAYSEENTEEYAVYFEELTKQYENVRLFLCCNVLTSCKALQCLAYTVALSLGNYRELGSDCLEYAKAVARTATELFATEHEIQKAAVNLRMQKLNLRALDELTVTNLKSEAMSRQNPVSRYPALSSILAVNSNLLLVVIVSFLTALLVIALDRFFLR